MSDTDAQTPGTRSGSDPFASFSQRRRRGVKVTTAAAVALGLALGGGAMAAAATPSTSPSASGSTGHPGRPLGGGTPPVAVGTVKSVGTDTFTLTTKDGIVTVDVGSTTTYRDAGITTPTFADVTVGEHVAVFGSESSGTLTATSVGIGNPPAGGPPGLGGPGGRGPGGTGPGGKGPGGTGPAGKGSGGTAPGGTGPAGKGAWSPTAGS
jgi:hypothetical protein